MNGPGQGRIHHLRPHRSGMPQIQRRGIVAGRAENRPAVVKIRTVSVIVKNQDVFTELNRRIAILAPIDARKTGSHISRVVTDVAGHFIGYGNHYGQEKKELLRLPDPGPEHSSGDRN